MKNLEEKKIKQKNSSFGQKVKQERNGKKCTKKAVQV